ncbi:MAG TPA: hypothetical protein VMZ53_12805 [Kofleriaceae bacterium]|nr:hypothetical protein [Kofleriaceae bacterium]
MKLVGMLAVLVVALLGGTARAEKTQKVTALWSPIHLVLPVVEVEGEFNAAPHIGAGLILGAGRVSSEDDTVTATVFEVGAQFNYYFLRPFHGLHAGAEANYVHAGDVAQDSSLTATGLELGPYVGYKVLTDIGFTFVAQVGVAFLTLQAENSSGTVMPTKPKDVFPLINLNIGWSF